MAKTFTAVTAGNWSAISTWHTLTGAAWAALTDYSANNYVVPTVANGYVYKCTTDGGSSGAGEPTWGTTVGGTTADGDLVWTCENGTPVAGDSVALAGYVIVWDTSITTIPPSGSLVSISSTGTAGQISLALDNAAFHGGASLSCTTITAGTKPAAAGIVLVTGTTDHVLTITVGTGAGQGIIGSPDAWESPCINNNSTGTINVTGNVTASEVTYFSDSIQNNSTGTINITGNVTGKRGHGINNASTGSVNITGNVTGGIYNAEYGIHNASTGTVSVDGIITGGSGARAPGIYSPAGNVTLSENTKLIYGTHAPAYMGKAPAWQPASTSYAKFYVGASFGQDANTEFPQVLAAENIKAGVTSGSVTGTLVQTVKTLFSILTPSGWQKGI